MNSKSLRRLAADHSALHNSPLPPNYLFPPSATDSDSLTDLDILLAGPLSTPFAAGLWRLHLTIPPDYPQHPPTANFRTPIFHPNVDPQTGGVCVETLKRDWDSKLTLRDVLVTISCLLILPNPDSALNAEAGALIREGYEGFERRARLMTGISAGVPKGLAGEVREAQTRGQVDEDEDEDVAGPASASASAPAPDPVLAFARGQESSGEDEELEDSMIRQAAPAPAPMRRRRGVARLISAAASRRSEGSPSGAVGTGRQHMHLQQHALPGPSSNRPFIAQGSTGSDPFGGGGISIREDPPLGTPQIDPSSDDESIESADQENDVALSPTKPREPPRKLPAGTPRRPHGAAPVPLGELSLEDASPPPDSPTHSDPSSSASSIEEEEEYPPSPRKSPTKSKAKSNSKSPVKPLPLPPAPNNLFFNSIKPQRSAALFGTGPAAAAASRNFTPPNALARPLASDSPYTGTTPQLDDDTDTTMLNPTPSPRKTRTRTAGAGLLLGAPAAKKNGGQGQGHHDPAARTLFGGPPKAKASRSSSRGVVSKPASPLSSPSSAEKRRQRDKRLWMLCGGHVRKWNRGEFGVGCEEGGFEMKAARW